MSLFCKLTITVGFSCGKNKFANDAVLFILKGMFSEGLMHGHGTYTWADGVKYEVKCNLIYN